MESKDKKRRRSVRILTQISETIDDTLINNFEEKYGSIWKDFSPEYISSRRKSMAGRRSGIYRKQSTSTLDNDETTSSSISIVSGVSSPELTRALDNLSANNSLNTKANFSATTPNLSFLENDEMSNSINILMAETPKPLSAITKENINDTSINIGTKNGIKDMEFNSPDYPVGVFTDQDSPDYPEGVFTALNNNICQSPLLSTEHLKGTPQGKRFDAQFSTPCFIMKYDELTANSPSQPVSSTPSIALRKLDSDLPYTPTQPIFETSGDHSFTAEIAECVGQNKNSELQNGIKSETKQQSVKKRSSKKLKETQNQEKMEREKKQTYRFLSICKLFGSKMLNVISKTHENNKQPNNLKSTEFCKPLDDESATKLDTSVTTNMDIYCGTKPEFNQGQGVKSINDCQLDKQQTPAESLSLTNGNTNADQDKHGESFKLSEDIYLNSVKASASVTNTCESNLLSDTNNYIKHEKAAINSYSVEETLVSDQSRDEYKVKETLVSNQSRDEYKVQSEAVQTEKSTEEKMEECLQTNETLEIELNSEQIDDKKTQLTSDMNVGSDSIDSVEKSSEISTKRRGRPRKKLDDPQNVDSMTLMGQEDDEQKVIISTIGGSNVADELNLLKTKHGRPARRRSTDPLLVSYVDDKVPFNNHNNDHENNILMNYVNSADYDQIKEFLSMDDEKPCPSKSRSRRRSADTLTFSVSGSTVEDDVEVPVRRTTRLKRRSIEIYQAGNNNDCENSANSPHSVESDSPGCQENSLDTNSKPVRKRKMKEENIEDIYRNKNFKKPEERNWETIYESPDILKNPDQLLSKKRFRRSIAFEPILPAKTKKRSKKAADNGWDAKKRKKIQLPDEVVIEKLAELDNILKSTS